MLRFPREIKIKASVSRLWEQRCMMKKVNLGHHYSWKHAAKPNIFWEDKCLDKVNTLKTLNWWSLCAQQAVFTRPYYEVILHRQVQ